MNKCIEYKASIASIVKNICFRLFGNIWKRHIKNPMSCPINSRGRLRQAIDKNHSKKDLGIVWIDG